MSSNEASLQSRAPDAAAGNAGPTTRRAWLATGVAGLAGVGTALLPAVSARAAARVDPRAVLRSPSPTEAPIPVAVSEQAHRPFIEQLFDLLFSAAGLRYELIALPWPRALLSGEQGQALVYGLSRSAQREGAMDFSAPIFASHAWLVVDRDRPLRWGKLEDLRGKVLCAARGASFGVEFDGLVSRGVLQVEHSGFDFNSRIRMLTMGRCDAMLTAHRGSTPARLVRRLQALPDGERLQVLPRPLTAETIHFAVSKRSPLSAALLRLDAAIRRERAAIQAMVDSEP